MTISSSAYMDELSRHISYRDLQRINKRIRLDILCAIYDHHDRDNEPSRLMRANINGRLNRAIRKINKENVGIINDYFNFN